MLKHFIKDTADDNEKCGNDGKCIEKTLIEWIEWLNLFPHNIPIIGWEMDI